jgi:hypothetical protein
MRFILPAMLLLGSCSGRETSTEFDLPTLTAGVVGAAAQEHPAAPVVRVEVSPVEGETDLYVALRDWEAHWWGDFIAFRFAAGAILWTTAPAEDDRPGEQSILSVRGFRLPGFSDPFVEVFGQTHMGNGDFYLYLWQGRNLRPVLRTRAVDRHYPDVTVLRDGRLQAAYRDLDGDGIPEVILSGFIDELPPEDHEGRPLRSTPCRKVFAWGSQDARFSEDSRRRLGFEKGIDNW